jgi:hypothetical protein
VIGALAGAAAHRRVGASAGDRHQASMGEDVAAGAAIGCFVGWLTGRTVIGRARWRPVTIP